MAKFQKNKIIIFLGIILTILFLPQISLAATYYVDGVAGNDTNPGTLESPWKTTQKANITLQAGDTVYIRGGTYAISGSAINPSNSGTPGNPITFSNYNNEMVEFIGTGSYPRAVDLNSDTGTIRNYIIVKGFIFTNFYMQMWILRGSYNEVAYNTFQGVGPTGQVGWRGSTIYRNAQYNHIHHNTFCCYGTFSGGSAVGAVFELGNENVSNDNTSYNLIENNQFYYGGHHVLGWTGNHNVIRNNYFHNEPWWRDPNNPNAELGSYRVLYTAGPGPGNERNLLEGNRVSFAEDTDWVSVLGGSGGTLSTSYNILRRNIFDNNGTYGQLVRVYDNNSSIYNKIYHNVFWHMGYTDSQKGLMDDSYRYGIHFRASASGCSKIYNNAVKNNIFYQNKLGSISGDAGCQIITNNILETSDPMFVNISGTPDPMNWTQFDFRLQSGSPAINAGGFLTTITSASDSGTQFQVGDAGYFMDGWGIIKGDTIQFQGQAQTAIITNVDYIANTITTDASLTWTQGQGITLVYSGSAPDIGAYEYVEAAPPPPPPDTTPPSAPTGLQVQ